MPIKTFEFSSVDGRRFVKPTDRWLNLRVDHNSTVTLISELGDRQASLDFRFPANYHAPAAGVRPVQHERHPPQAGRTGALAQRTIAAVQMQPPRSLRHYT